MWLQPHMHQEFSHTKRDTALTNPDVTEGMNKVLTQQHPVRVSLCLKKKKKKEKRPHLHVLNLCCTHRSKHMCPCMISVSLSLSLSLSHIRAHTHTHTHTHTHANNTQPFSCYGLPLSMQMTFIMQMHTNQNRPSENPGWEKKGLNGQKNNDPWKEICGLGRVQGHSKLQKDACEPLGVDAITILYKKIKNNYK